MGIATGQWRARIGSWHVRFKFQLPGADTNSISASSAIFFYALVLVVLLVVGGVELNPGPNTQSCCELCGIDLDMMQERELALDEREEAVFVMLQHRDESLLVVLRQREAACDIREQALEQRETLLQSREAAVERREKLVAEKEKNSGTSTANQEPGGVELVRSLLEKDMISITGLLEWAVLNSYVSIAQFLIKVAKLDVNAKDSSGRSVLFLAVEHGLLAAVELLLPLSTEDVVKDSTGKLAFHSAVSKGHIDVVKLLISDNRSLARKKSNNGWTALHIAALYGHLEIVKFLVQEAHSDVEMKGNLGWTALHCAASCSRFSVAKFLVQEAQADVGSKTSDGSTAFQLSRTPEMNNLICPSS